MVLIMYNMLKLLHCYRVPFHQPRNFLWITYTKAESRPKHYRLIITLLLYYMVYRFLGQEDDAELGFWVRACLGVI